MPIPRFQFRLKTLLAVLAAFLIWLGFHADRRHRQMRAVSAIEALGGHVSYQDGANAVSGPVDFARRIGNGFIRGVSAVYLARRTIDDTDLDCLAELPALETVNLCSTPLTDAGLERLAGLKRLKLIDVRFTHVTEQGVDRLRTALPSAKILRVSDTE